MKYVRYSQNGSVTYGQLEGDSIQPLDGAPWADGRPAGQPVLREAVRLLAPVEPSKVIAVGLNYRSHLGDRPVPTEPGLFAKFPTSIADPDAEIVYPDDARNVHFEGELVIVIGKKAKKVPRDRALEYVFGVTAGNDLSERDWQRNDLQWFRAKGADAFGPVGPAIATGVNYLDLQLTTRLNGEIVQQQRTSDLIFDLPEIVSYISRYVTLLPGDVIFTGTPGSTRAMQPGDVIEIELEEVGVLRNTIGGRGQ